jgi:hypothetical protein
MDSVKPTVVHAASELVRAIRGGDCHVIAVEEINKHEYK